MKKSTPSWLRVIIVFFTIFIAAELLIDAGDKPCWSDGKHPLSKFRRSRKSTL